MAQQTPVAEALFHDRAEAVEAVDRLLDAHIPAKDIEVVADGSAEVPVRHHNRMARTALVGAVGGLSMSMLWLLVGATGWVQLPVMQGIIDAVGVVGAGLRLGFLGLAAGTVAGALGGLRTTARPDSPRKHVEGAHRIVVQLDHGERQAIQALRESEPDTLRIAGS